MVGRISKHVCSSLQLCESWADLCSFRAFSLKAYVRSLDRFSCTLILHFTDELTLYNQSCNSALPYFSRQVVALHAAEHLSWFRTKGQTPGSPHNDHPMSSDVHWFDANGVSQSTRSRPMPAEEASGPSSTKLVCENRLLDWEGSGTAKRPSLVRVNNTSAPTPRTICNVTW